MSGKGETIKTTIYLVRHGECKANVEDMNLPPEIDVLTEKGKQQAAVFGKAYHDVRFDRAVASTYSRAYDTATEIIANLDEKPELKQDSRIREREMGVYENRRMYELFGDLFAAAKAGTHLLDFEVEGGESVADLDARMCSFLQELLDSIRQNRKPETILIVSHGVIIMRMMFKLSEWSKDPARSISIKSWEPMKVANPIKNTGYHLLTVEVPKNGPGTTAIEYVKVHQAGHLDSMKSEAKKPSAEFMQSVKTFQEIVSQQCTTH
ncbi:putative phosphoglycerate mutase GpmB [Orchesella cincta]|uniref:Fructose-2,6-bisphosphatase TIGAR n=1 Tax=Orchesella cincta TaxID=48709 RepID=A0A1D2NJZ3_ORCCI|nr:putative phosphoglycerate mutase GpmB [Orchesella cincta]